MPSPPLYAVAPFVALLAAIAVTPLWVPAWWASNRNKLLLSSILAVPVVAAYLARAPQAVLDTGEEYVSFMILLTGLYVIAGGIRLTGDLEATPLVNTGFLAAGALLASVLGTTGASMVLIRPLLQTNQERRHVAHTVVFFIFLVANIGGTLTPLGDPPLFLGYLEGVPFAWTLRLWRPWLCAVAALLLVYFVWDSIHHAREPRRALRHDRARRTPLRVAGAVNGVWLLAVVGAVAGLRAPWREAAILGLVACSVGSTPAGVRRANRFSLHALTEVAVLFVGIFATMIPALELLHRRGAELGVREPWQFFWATGLLSSVLDNAPTYLTFLALGRGLGLANEVAGVPHAVLAGITLGAVFMGANTYIGNAPNFMVKAIAEDAGIPMPTFLGYLGYSGAVLLPLFALISLLFL